MTTTAVLTKAAYDERLASITADLATQTTEYEQAALLLEAGGISSAELARKRSALAELEQQRQDLNAAWRAAQVQARAEADTAAAQLLRETGETIDDSLAQLVSVAGEIERTTARLEGLFTTARSLERDVFGAAGRHVKISGIFDQFRRIMELQPVEKVLFGDRVEQFPATKQYRGLEDATRATAAKARTRIRKMLGLPAES